MKNYRKLLFEVISRVLFSIFLFLVVYIICNNIEIRNYIVPQSREYMIMFLEICIGIYATIVTILASQNNRFTVLLVKKDLDYKFVVAIVSGMIINLFTCLILSVVKANCIWGLAFELTLCLLSFLCFSYFLVLLIIMFRFNISNALDEEEEKKTTINNIMTDIAEIRKRIGK